MSNFKLGDIVWWWDNAAGQPRSGIVLEVQEVSNYNPTLTVLDPLIQYTVFTNGRRRLLIEGHLKRSLEDCKRSALFVDDIVPAQLMTAPAEWVCLNVCLNEKKKGEDNE
jgi:hypothetical protein